MDTIFIKKVPYYKYGEFNEWNDALKIAKYQKKRNKKNKYYIMICEKGFWFPEKKYILYMNRIINLSN